MKTLEEMQMKYNNIPWFFSLEKDNKISYLLGTCHVLSMEEIHVVCMKIIKRCSNLITEAAEPSEEELTEFYTKMVLRDKTKSSWVNSLPGNIKEFFKKYTAIYYQKIGLTWELDDLEMWAAVEATIFGLYAFIKGATEIDDMKTSMESDLRASIFNNKYHGLETIFDQINTFKDMSKNIDDLIDLYREAQKLLNSNNSEDSEVLRYRQALELYQPIDIEETNADKELVIRNKNWIPNIIKYHATIEGPSLFCVGGDHLLGEMGLLSLLPKFGFKIKRLTPNESFEDYSYPFNSFQISSKILSQEKFMKSRTNQFIENSSKSFFLHSYQKFCQDGLLDKLKNKKCVKKISIKPL